MTNGKETFTNEIDFSDYDKQKDLTVMENRYDKYKDSGIAWIGEIPEHWEVCKLSTLFFQHKQRNNDTQESNLLSLSYGNIKKKDINTSEGLLPESFENYNIIDKDDIVFRLTDLQNDKKSLRSALCRERGIITSAYVTIRKRGNVNSSYFNYLFRAYDECKVFYGLGDGVRQGMNFDDLRKLEILLPQQIIQQAIADYLDRRCSEIDDLIALQEEMITKLQSYKQSVITEAVTRGLDKNVPLKDSGIDWIGKIPKHWEIVKIKNIFNISSGATPKTDNMAYWDGEIIWITPADYKTEDKIIKSGKRNITLAGLNSCGTSIIPKDSIIFSKRAPIGLVAINVVPLCTNQGCISCIPKSFVYSKYFYFLMSVLTEWFELFGSGTTFKELSTNNFANFNLSYPPLAEQQAIADYLDQRCSEIDELIALKQQKIEKLKEYKKSLIFECVTGKRKVS